MLVSVRLTGEEQSDVLQLFFTTNSHKPKHSNLQEVVSMLGDDVCGNFIKNNIGPSRVSFRVISTHLYGCWLFFVGVGICWPRTIANFNITLFRPHAGVQPEVHFLGVFSHTVSNIHPYGIVAQVDKKTPKKCTSGCTPARGLNTVMLKFAMVRGEQRPTPTKKSQQPSKWVLMTRKETRECPMSSRSMLTTSWRFECLALWGFVVKNNYKISDCSSPEILSNVH